MNEKTYEEDLDHIVLEAMGLEVRPVHLDEWIQQELARRYLLGAIRYLDDMMVKTFAHENVIPALDAKAILVNSLNLNTSGFEKFLQDLSNGR